MINLKALTVTAIASVAVVGFTPEAHAGCYPALAAQNIANIIRGGGSNDEAIDWAVSQGNLDSVQCVKATAGYMRSLPYIFGDIIR